MTLFRSLLRTFRQKCWLTIEAQTLCEWFFSYQESKSVCTCSFFLFWPWIVGVCHSMFWFPSHTQTPKSCPVTTHSRKWGSFLIAPKKSRLLSFLMWFCSCERFVGTVFAKIYLIPNSLVKISWKIVWVKFNSLLIIWTAN